MKSGMVMTGVVLLARWMGDEPDTLLDAATYRQFHDVAVAEVALQTHQAVQPAHQVVQPHALRRARGPRAPRRVPP